MKKLTIVAPLMFLVLSACSPQDPAVLTPQEKAAKNKYKGNGNFGGVTAATLTAQPDATGASYLLDRHSEILSLASLALDFAQGVDLQARLGSCVSILKLQRSTSLLEVRLDLDSCARDLAKQSLRQTGAYTILIGYDESQKLRSIKINSASIDQRGFSVLTTELRKNSRPRDSVRIRESIAIELFKQDISKEIWTVVSADSVAEAKILAKENETQNLITKTRGSIEVLSSEAGAPRQFAHSLSSILRLEAKKDNQEKTEFFDLALVGVDSDLSNKETVSSCSERAGKYKIKFKYRFNRDGDELAYECGRVKINSNPKVSATEIGTLTCAESVQGRKGGLFNIDWALLFL